MENKYQHIIPQGYLKAWCTPDPPPGHKGKIWVIQKANPDDKVLKSPKNHFGRDDHYTISAGGGRDLQIEKALGKTETAFSKVMKRG